MTTRIELLPAVADDLDRRFDPLLAHEVRDAPSRIREMIAALDILESHPLIGRRYEDPAVPDGRALIIGRGARGYVALYQYSEKLDTVFVLALRAQREAGYKRP